MARLKQEHVNCYTCMYVFKITGRQEAKNPMSCKIDMSMSLMSWFILYPCTLHHLQLIIVSLSIQLAYV